MDSIKNIYKIGHGPSSSHTMAPYKACINFKEKYKAYRYEVILYGSLALTGKGHLTDKVIKEALGDNTIINYNIEKRFKYHPNAMQMYAYDKEDNLVGEDLIFSIGGGELRHKGENRNILDIYKEKSMQDILNFCKLKGLSLLDYINMQEDLDDYLQEVWNVMQDCFQRGINSKEILPGPLKLNRKGGDFFKKYQNTNDSFMLIYSASIAISEENASGGTVVTAPTCGSCGVVPAILIYAKVKLLKTDKEIIDALKIAGLFGLLAKSNASISGAEVGCQGEVGVACSMASAGLCYLLNGTNYQIEYAAEIALEHHLGLTCDPVNGQVQIPCIERNAIASIKALGAAEYAINTNGKHIISFDQVLKTMMETGLDLSSKYKETSIGGLAKNNEDIC